MQATAWRLTLVAISAVLVQGCDKKSETAEESTANVVEQPVVEATTTTTVVTAETDAGPEAGAAVVGVLVTTIATTGNADIVNGIAQARCQREQRCGNIGTDEDYKSLDDCLTKIATEWRDDLNLYECPGGVDQKELAECVEEIQNEDCNNPFDSLGRIVACRSSDLCLSTR